MSTDQPTSTHKVFPNSPLVQSWTLWSYALRAARDCDVRAAMGASLVRRLWEAWVVSYASYAAAGRCAKSLEKPCTPTATAVMIQTLTCLNYFFHNCLVLSFLSARHLYLSQGSLWSTDGSMNCFLSMSYKPVSANTMLDCKDTFYWSFADQETFDIEQYFVSQSWM